jgi:hypothetical protein
MVVQTCVISATWEIHIGRLQTEASPSKSQGGPISKTNQVAEVPATQEAKVK